MAVEWLAAGTENLRSILHIGADKCGSSSIQSFLSHHRTLKTGPEESRLTYACLTANGLKIGAKIERRLKKSIGGYISSVGTSRIQRLPEKRLALTREAVAQISEDLILSCEGWLRALPHRTNFAQLLDLVAPDVSGRDVELVAFVRPPAKWINSAWWQWGVWGQNVDFDQWLVTAISSVQWYKYLSHATSYSSVRRLTVEPVDRDVVKQLIETLDIMGCDDVRVPSNKSLPAEALQFFLEHRQHRPHAHASFNDFLIGHSIASHSSHYGSTPWVLSQRHVQLIIEATHQSNLKLLDLMTDPWKQKVLDDLCWWDASAFASLQCVDPYLPMSSQTPLSYQLTSDLFSSLGEAVRILRSRGLLQEYLHALADNSSSEE